MKARQLAAAAAVLVVVALLAPAAHAHGGPPPVPPPTGTAGDGPGALSHFDLARKDCVGTARNRRSKVWYTIADGVLSDVYFPTNDNTNVETLQYVVTDGSTFTDLQTRNMTYTVAVARQPRARLPRHRHRQERPLQDRHRLRHRPGPRDRRDGREADRAERAALRPQALRPPRPDAQRQRRRRRRATAARTAARSSTSHGHNVLVGSDPVTADQRGQPRLRRPGLQRARRRPPVPRGVQRLRRRRPATA